MSRTVIVRFDAELRLLDDECPEDLSYETLAQAVQDQIGHTGAVVINVMEFEVAERDTGTAG